jgi:tRNA dimethylallyltransferase
MNGSIEKYSMYSNPHTIILTGPTASGKTSLAIEAALELREHKINLEIINADSVCFYQEFNIGSAKPTNEEMELVPHHLINVAHPNENYHAGQFLKDCTKKLEEIHARKNHAIIVGGSGFYLKALRLGLWEAPATDEKFRATLEDTDTATLAEKLSSLDPVHAQKIGMNDRYRIIRALEIIEVGSGKTPSELEAEMSHEPDPRFELWVIDREKQELEERIRERIQKMLAAGWVDESKKLLQLYPQSKTLNAVGYRQVIDDLEGKLPQGRIKKPGSEGLIDEISLAHRQLAKTQRTWFKNLNPNESFELERGRLALKEKLMNFYQKG